MFSLSIISIPGNPTNLQFNRQELSKDRSTIQVEFLSKDMIDAYTKGWISITPPPPLLVLDSVPLVNNSGGVNLGMIVPEVTDIASAASAITVLADSHNRLIQDVMNLFDFARRTQDQLFAVSQKVG